MEKETSIEDVQTFKTSGGNTRFVVKDSDGQEYTTFREGIGQAAQQARGSRARLEFHEQQRGQYTNVYLDKVELLKPAGGEEGEDTDPEEAGWQTAVEAAPWLVGTAEPQEEEDPDALFEKLKPFKDRVAEDIRADGEDD
jgi:hypothetical protein